MDRLTARDNAGNAVCKREYADNCLGKCSDCDYDYECFKKLAYYEDLEEQGRLIILPAKAEADNRCCKTCYADDMDYKEVDIPCWNCNGDHSEWKPKEN